MGSSIANSLWKVVVACLAWMCATSLVQADSIVKANNSDNLNTTTAWVGGVVPSATDVGVWNSTVSGTTLTNALGGNLAVEGMVFTGFTGRAAILSGTTTLGNLGASTLTIGSGGVAAWKIVAISSTVRLASAQTWIVGNGAAIDVNDNKNHTGIPVDNQGYDLTVDVKTFNANGNCLDVDMSGSGDIVKNGPGQLYLRGGSSFTGKITLNEGIILGTGLENTFGTGSAELILNGGELWVGSNAARNYGRNVTVSANATIRNNNSNTTGPGDYRFADLTIGTSSLTVTSTCVAGSAALTTTGTLAFTSVTLTGNPTFYVPIMGCRTDVSAQDRNWLLLGSISESGGSQGFTKTGGGYLFLTNSSTYSGDTRVKEGYLTLNHTNAMAKSTLNMVSGDTGSLQWNASGTYTLGGLKGDRNLDLGGKTVAIGNNNGSTTYSAVLNNGSLQKVGSGTLTLSGNNTYSGTTEINDGALLVTGTHSGGGGYTVGTGAILGGDGAIASAVTVNGTIAPGVGGIGILEVNGNVTWNSGSSWSSDTDWQFDLGASGASDLLLIVGSFTKGSGSGFRFDFGGSTQEGTFTLVTWTVGTTFSASDFDFVNLGEGLSATFAIVGNELRVTVSACSPAPTVTPGASPTVCKGTTSASLSFSTTESPTSYRIDYSDTANAAGFADVQSASPVSSPVSLVIPANAPVGIYTAQLVVVAGACRGSAAFTVTVIDKPAVPGAISQSIGGSTVCLGASGITYSIAPVASATSYTWTFPDGVSIVSGQGTASVVVNWGALAAASWPVKVKASNTCGNSDDRTDNFTIVSGTPGAPTVDSADEVSTTAFLARWSAGSGTIGGYRLDVASSIDFTSGFVASNLAISAGTTSYFLSGLDSGVTYYYRVRAYNVCGNSDYSATTTVLTPQVLAGWDVSGLAGGSGNYGASPLSPTTLDDDLSGTGWTRGSGVAQDGTAAARGWGGTGWNGSSKSTAVDNGDYATTALEALAGRSVSYLSISKLDYRRAVNGPTTGVLQYSTDGSTFTDITTLNYSSSSDSGASIAVPIDLSGISALQDVAAGTEVTFRIVNYGASSASGPWYLYDVGTSSEHDFEVRGVICETPVAYAVTGGGAYCSAAATPGVAVGLAGSQERVTYYLYLDGGESPVAVKAGSGSAISFGLQSAVGAYTVKAVRNSGGCEANMTGSAVVSITQTPGAPTEVSATPADSQVALSWSSPGGSTGYNVWRSLSAGGPFVIVLDGTNVASTSFTDTSSLNGNTYYYKVTALNSGCEGDASDVVMAEMPGGCPAGFAPTMEKPANRTVTIGNTLTISVTASEVSAGCSPPSMTHSVLPSGMTYSDTASSPDRTRTFQWQPVNGQQGVYPITVVATDTESFETGVTFIVYVGNFGESGNGGSTPPSSQTNWSVAITEVNFDASGVATVVWDSVEGVQYDVYRSTAPIGASPNWSKVVSAQEAEGADATSEVSAAESMIFYQVVPQGQSRTDRGVWGVVKPTLGTFSMIAPPVTSDRRFDGAFGAALADAVPEGTLVHLMTPGAEPSWGTTLRRNASKEWRTDTGGALYSTPLPDGAAFFVEGASGSAPVFVGPVGNAGTNDVSLSVGYNLVGLSEGKGLSASTAFSAGSMTPDPSGSGNEALADQIILQNSNGSWRRLVRVSTGKWIDMTTGQEASVTLMPGQGYYYLRRDSSSTVSF